MNRWFLNPLERSPRRRSAASSSCRFVAILILTVGVCGCGGWRSGSQVASQDSGSSSQNPNVVDERILAPTLLNDQAEMSEYIEAFPEARYSVCNVPEVGDFFVDTTDDLIKASLCKGEMWESWNHELLEEYTEPGTTVIDVGAHIGTHTIVMSRMVGADGRVYAFEPQKKVFRELVSNLRLNGIDNVVPLRYAVGAEAGIIEMDPIWDKNEAATAVGKGGDQAELRTIDSFDFSNVSLIKIDVEGYEGYVLDGSEKTIRTWRPAIIIEIKGGEPSSTVSSPLPSPKDNENVSMVLGRLETWGYTAKRTNWHDYLALPDDSADPGGPPQ